MNEHFINGFVKAAKAVGMSDSEIENLLKQSNEGMPAMPPAPTEGGEEMPPEAGMEASPEGTPEGGQEAELEALISQLSPEEIEQLIAELTQQAGGEEAGAEEVAQIPELASAIEQQLGNNPEVAEATAPSPDLTEEAMAKQSAINFIKSAEYVEGFLEQAVNRGIGLKEAVELYDVAFTTTFNQLKSSELKGDQHKLDVDGDGKIEGADLKALREGKKKVTDVDEKTAAYYEGVIERCREYGMTDAESIEFVKSAARGLHRTPAQQQALGRDMRELASKIPGVGKYVKRKTVPDVGTREAPSFPGVRDSKLNEHMKKHNAGVEEHNLKVDANRKKLKGQAATAAVAGGAGAAAGYALGNSKKEDKE